MDTLLTLHSKMMNLHYIEENKIISYPSFCSLNDVDQASETGPIIKIIKIGVLFTILIKMNLYYIEKKIIKNWT